MKIKEGYMPFHEYETYYRIVGESKANKTPLVLVHGGPGSTHNYFEVLDRLAQEDDRALIMYDQLGCGKSSMPDRPELWRAETWIEELDALREHLGLDEIHFLGQSWGGMMAIQYACDYKPKGIKSYIISSGHPSSALWESEQRRRLKYLPQEMQDAIAKAEETGDYSTEEYQAAEDEFMIRHCNIEPENSPEPVTREKKSGSQAYLYGWGPNEFAPSGTLKDFDYVDQLKDIKEATLITNGIDDLCSPFIAKVMYDRIPNSEWELFQFSRHMPFVEENDKYVDLLIDWLNKND